MEAVQRAIFVIFCYFNFMAQATNMSKLAGTAGSILALVGMLIFFIGVFGYGPKSFVIAGVATIAVALAAFFYQEFSSRGY